MSNQAWRRLSRAVRSVVNFCSIIAVWGLAVEPKCCWALFHVQGGSTCRAHIFAGNGPSEVSGVFLRALGHAQTHPCTSVRLDCTLWQNPLLVQHFPKKFPSGEGFLTLAPRNSAANGSSDVLRVFLRALGSIFSHPGTSFGSYYWVLKN